MDYGDAQKWAESCARAGMDWAYSDGWLTVYDMKAGHIMLAYMHSELMIGNQFLKQDPQWRYFQWP